MNITLPPGSIVRPSHQAVLFQSSSGNTIALGSVDYSYVSSGSNYAPPLASCIFIVTSHLSNYISHGFLCPPGHQRSPSSCIGLPICLLCLTNASFLAPVLYLLVPLPPSTIRGWRVFKYPHRSMSLLEGCPTFSALDAPLVRPLPVQP